MYKFREVTAKSPYTAEDRLRAIEEIAESNGVTVDRVMEINSYRRSALLRVDKNIEKELFSFDQHYNLDQDRAYKKQEYRRDRTYRVLIFITWVLTLIIILAALTTKIYERNDSQNKCHPSNQQSDTLITHTSVMHSPFRLQSTCKNVVFIPSHRKFNVALPVHPMHNVINLIKF